MATARNPKLNRKARECRIVSRNPNGLYHVASPSGSTYTVNLGLGGVCSCPWGQKGNAGCSHERAARADWAEWTRGRKVSFQNGDPKTVARKQHKATLPAAPGLVMVLRDKVDPVADLLDKVNEVGARHRALCRRQDLEPYIAGPESYQLRDEIATVAAELDAATREWVAASNERVREAA